MYHQRTLQGFDRPISSPESADGPTHSGSPAGPIPGPCGPDPALASLSPRQALEKGLMTKDTFGRTGDGYSISDDLQSSLESRLRAVMDVNGSPEYVLTWKQWGMRSGPPICALRASARRTSGSDCSGWPTAKGSDGTKGARIHRGARKELDRKGPGADLPTIAAAAGWPTPMSTERNASPETMKKRKDFRKSNANQNTVPLYLNEVARIAAGDIELVKAAGWPTPAASESRQGFQNRANGKRGNQKSLTTIAVEATFGPTQPGYLAPTEKRGALNSELSRWLLGFPVEWGFCGDTAMRLCRKSRQHSSRP